VNKVEENLYSKDPREEKAMRAAAAEYDSIWKYEVPDRGAPNRHERALMAAVRGVLRALEEPKGVSPGAYSVEQVDKAIDATRGQWGSVEGMRAALATASVPAWTLSEDEEEAVLVFEKLKPKTLKEHAGGFFYPVSLIDIIRSRCPRKPEPKSLGQINYEAKMGKDLKSYPWKNCGEEEQLENERAAKAVIEAYEKTQKKL
jgi:hypothetical protein